MMSNLLQQRLVAALVADAELIRDWNDASEHLRQSRAHVRLALRWRAISRPTHDGRVVARLDQITDDELRHTYAILDFSVVRLLPRLKSNPSTNRWLTTRSVISVEDARHWIRGQFTKPPKNSHPVRLKFDWMTATLHAVTSNWFGCLPESHRNRRCRSKR